MIKETHPGTHCNIVTCSKEDGTVNVCPNPFFIFVTQLLKDPVLVPIEWIRRTVLISPVELLFTTQKKLVPSDWEYDHWGGELQVIDEVQSLDLVAHPHTWADYKYKVSLLFRPNLYRARLFLTQLSFKEHLHHLQAVEAIPPYDEPSLPQHRSSSS
jgi:hypothetical protein